MGNSEYYEGKGCRCNARNKDECACNADWTPKEVYVLRAKVAGLEKELSPYRASELVNGLLGVE